MLLGVVTNRQKVRADITLINHGLQELSIDRIQTSCPCLATTPGSIRILPGESTVLAVEFDPSAEPNFHGELSVEVVGYEAHNKIAFRTHVNLEVRRNAADERDAPRLEAGAP